MLDWQEVVRQRLSGLAFEDCSSEEVFAELAGHLEETYDRLRGEGLSENDAVRDPMSEVKDWRYLREEICFARTKEKPVTPRTKRFWLPSLVTLLVTMVMLPILESFGLKAQFLFLTGPHDRSYVFTVYTAWLMMLPFVGALGASVSRRAEHTLPRSFPESFLLWRSPSLFYSFFRSWDFLNTDSKRMRVPFSRP